MHCCDQAGLTPVEDAVGQLLSSAHPIAEWEKVPIGQAMGRILAEDLISPVDVPPADNSAMDGYALRYVDLEVQGQTRLPISQRIPAGTAPAPLVPHTAARIFTGAEIPPGADSVVMQEICDEVDGGVVLPQGIGMGDHIRTAGQDIERGSKILCQGHRLLPQDLGLIASVGIAQVRVYRRLKLAVISTGDEVIEPGRAIAAGEIYNSNRYTLAGLVSALGMEMVDLGIVADDVAATERALLEAVDKADVVITTGGVSVGDEDYVKTCVEKLGHLQLWRLAIKPGKPLAFGEVAGKPFFGLPGNPAAVLVTFSVVARPYLLRLQGANELMPLTLSAKADFERRGKARRQEYLRARLSVSEDGNMLVSPHPNQSSGALSSASWGNGLVIHPRNQTVAPGDAVKFIPYSELFG